MSKRIAIITGASSGLGQMFVQELDGFCKDASERRDGGAGITRPEEIWAIARREERLAALQTLTEIPVRPLACDLTDPASIQALQDLLAAERPEIVLLINAAGYGKIGPTADLSLHDVTGMVDLNCRAAVAVTQICLPYMQAGDRIMEICSTAAFQPFTRLNVYAATKAFLYSYSRALAVELRPRKIGVTAVCPYWIKDTEFISGAEQGTGGFARDEDGEETSIWSEILNRSDNEDIRSYPLADRCRSVVRMALMDASLGMRVSTPGVICTIHRVLRHLLPMDLLILAWEGIRRI